MLIDAVKAHEGKLEYLYVDIDQHQNIAQLLRVSNLDFYESSSTLPFSLTIDPTRPRRILGSRWSACGPVFGRAERIRQNREVHRQGLRGDEAARSREA